MELNEYFDSFSPHDAADFSKSQMKIIRKALKADYLPEEMKFLDNPKYSLQQMNEVFDAMQEGQDVSQIASASMDVKEMQRVREKMRNADIQITEAVEQNMEKTSATATKREEQKNMDTNLSMEDPDMDELLQQMEAEEELQNGMELEEMTTTVNEDVMYAFEDSVNYDERLAQSMNEINRETTGTAARTANGKMPEEDIKNITDSGELHKHGQEKDDYRKPAIELTFQKGITRRNAFEVMEALQKNTDRVFYFKVDEIYTFYSDTFKREDAIRAIKTVTPQPERTDIVKGGAPKDILKIQSTAKDEASAEDLAAKIARYTNVKAVISHQEKPIFTDDYIKEGNITLANDLGRNQMEKAYRKVLLSDAPHERIAFFKKVADTFNKDPLNFKDNMFAMAAKECTECNMEILRSARELSNHLTVAAERGVPDEDIKELKRSANEIKKMALHASKEKKELIQQYADAKGGVAKGFGKNNLIASRESLKAIQNDLGGLTLTRIADMEQKISCHMKNMEKNGVELKSLVSKPGLITQSAISQVKNHFKQRECNSLTVEHSLDKLHIQKIDKKLEVLLAKNKLEKERLSSQTKEKQQKYNQKAAIKQQKKNLFRYGKSQITVRAKQAKQKTSLKQKILEAKINKLYTQQGEVKNRMEQAEMRIIALKTEIVQDAISQKIAREAKGMNTMRQDNIIRENTKLADVLIGEECKKDSQTKNEQKTGKKGKVQDEPDMADAARRAAERNQKQKADKTKSAPKQDMDAR